MSDMPETLLLLWLQAVVTTPKLKRPCEKALSVSLALFCKFYEKLAFFGHVTERGVWPESPSTQKC